MFRNSRFTSRLLSLIAWTLLVSLFAGPTVAQEWICHIKPQAGALDSPAVSVTITADSSRPTRSGEPVTISWSLTSRPAPECRSPLYLILSMHDRVRFKGEGFFVLPPGVAGPFGIKSAQSRTRVFVPLHLGAPVANGRLEVMSFAVGALDLAWEVVEVPALVVNPKSKKDFAWGKEVMAPGTAGSAQVAIAQGKPVVVLQDRFTTEQPKKVIVHEAAGYEIHEYPKLFRVIERASGEMIAERVGVGPQFSPTGRFVISFGVPSDGRDENRTEMIVSDLRTGAIALDHRRTEQESFGAGYVWVDTVRWGLGDAYLSVSHPKLAGITLIPTLIDRAMKTNAEGPNCCGAVGSTEHYIDLEQTAASYRMKEMNADWTNDSIAFSEDGWFEATSAAEAKEMKAIRSELIRLGNVIAAHHVAEQKAAKARKQEYKHIETEDDRRELELQARLNKLLEVTDAAGRRKFAETHQLTPHGESPVIDLRPREKWDSGGRVAQAGATPGGKEASTVLSKAMRQRSALTTAAGEPMIAAGDRLRQRLAEWGLLVTKPRPEARALREPARKDGQVVDKRWFLTPLALDIPAAADAVGTEDPTSYLQGCSFDSVDDADTEPHARGFQLDAPRPAGVPARAIGNESVYAARSWRVNGERIWLVENQCTEGTGGQLYGHLILLRNGGRSGARAQWLSLAQFEGQTVGELLASYDARTVIAEILHNRYLVLASEGKPRIAVFDLEAEKVVHVFESPSRHDVIQRILLTDDGRHLVQYNNDGGLQIYSMETRKRIAGGRFIDDEIVFFDDRGYYGGTPEGAHYVFLKFPGVPGQHSFYQFRATLNRPDLIRTLLKEGRLDAPEPQLPAPPVVTFTWSVAEKTPEERTASISIKASAEAGLSNLRIFVDGRLAREEPASGGDVARNVSLNVPAATRWVTVQAIDAKGVESVPSAAGLKPATNAKPQGRLYAIAVGTDTYSDPRIPALQYARSDAASFLKVAKSAEGRTYRSVTSEPMLDAPGLKTRLGARLEVIAKEATAADTIMLFVAAHGALDKNGRFYVTTTETRLDDLASTAFPSDLIGSALANTKARVVVFLDTCHSGAATGLATNDDAAAAFLDRRSAVTVIAAAKGRQESEERTDLAGGVFTHALAEAIIGQRAATDVNRNGAVELTELYSVLKRRVVEQTKGAQTPWIARNNMVGEIPLF